MANQWQMAQEKVLQRKPFFVVAGDVELPELDGNIFRFGTTAELEGKIALAEVLIVRSQKIDASVLEKAESLKLIIRQGVGTDNIDVDFANAKGIDVFNTPLSTQSVAELTIGFMIMASRRLLEAHSTMERNLWEKESLAGSELFCKTLGIVGFGRIGRRVASIAHAMGMKVIYFDPFVDEAFFEKKFSLESLLAESDVISFHVPLTNETFHMLNTENMRFIKNGAILINTSRGKVIQPEALEQALKEETLSFACLDVHYNEPPDYSELCKLGSVILSPHIGGSTIEAFERMRQRIREILQQKGFC